MPRCKRHGRYSCSTCDSSESNSNLGQPSINTDGGLSIGIGSGLAIDPSDGSLGVQVGGVTFDF